MSLDPIKPTFNSRNTSRQRNVKTRQRNGSGFSSRHSTHLQPVFFLLSPIKNDYESILTHQQSAGLNLLFSSQKDFFVKICDFIGIPQKERPRFVKKVLDDKKTDGMYQPHNHSIVLNAASRKNLLKLLTHELAHAKAQLLRKRLTPFESAELFKKQTLHFIKEGEDFCLGTLGWIQQPKMTPQEREIFAKFAEKYLLAGKKISRRQAASLLGNEPCKITNSLIDYAVTINKTNREENACISYFWPPKQETDILRKLQSYIAQINERSSKEGVVSVLSPEIGLPPVLQKRLYGNTLKQAIFLLFGSDVLYAGSPEEAWAFKVGARTQKKFFKSLVENLENGDDWTKASVIKIILANKDNLNSLWFEEEINPHNILKKLLDSGKFDKQQLLLRFAKAQIQKLNYDLRMFNINRALVRLFHNKELKEEAIKDLGFKIKHENPFFLGNEKNKNLCSVLNANTQLFDEMDQFARKWASELDYLKKRLHKKTTSAQATVKRNKT